MKRIALAMFAAAATLAAFQSAPSLEWAYGYLNPLKAGEPVAPACSATSKPFPDCAYAGAPVPADGVLHELPGAPQKYTRIAIYDDFGPADWYPDDHPAMPDVVAHGKRDQGVRACALCHYPNGQGKMENGGVAGLPAAYILQQLNAFKTGARRSGDPRKANTNEMARIAQLLTDDEAKAAANYFASMKWRPWVKVVESATAPAVRNTVNGLFLAIPDAERIQLGQRIIEVAENPERTDVTRDPHSGFIAYVPVGAIAKGQELATTENKKTKQCGTCHGPDLKGKANIPGIAGRTASYLSRQLWDMKQGARKSPAMAAAVVNLDAEDVVNLVAYASSREP
ncbi:MAG: c-type cytochrome [Bryobacteraceae bacterium]